MANLLGGYEFEDFTKNKQNLPPKAETAWAVVEGITDAKFTLIKYCGKQLVRGTNYLFIAEKSTLSLNPQKSILKIVVNEFQGEFELVKDKCAVIFG